jgi:hypothetical protein
LLRDPLAKRNVFFQVAVAVRNALIGVARLDRLLKMLCVPQRIEVGIKTLHTPILVVDETASTIVRQSRKENSEKSCSFITFCFYVLSLEYPQALCPSI